MLLGLFEVAVTDGDGEDVLLCPIVIVEIECELEPMGSAITVLGGHHVMVYSAFSERGQLKSSLAIGQPCMSHWFTPAAVPSLLQAKVVPLVTT